MYIGRELCHRAAELEPALIFPDFIFTQILEARHCPGTIAIEPDLILRLLDNVCREIARNGLHKIVIVNAHGGNNNLIHFFSQIQLAGSRDYVVYVAEAQLTPDEATDLKAQWETTVDGHAGEIETSAILTIRPDLVRQDQLLANDEGIPLDRLKKLRELGVDTGIWWYADHPTHYRGNGNPATAEKGERFLATQARALARTIRAIKEDGEAKRLQDEFFAAAKQHD
jgi:creatinine amidohydrolase